MDRGAWQATVYGVTKSQTQRVTDTFTFHTQFRTHECLFTTSNVLKLFCTTSLLRNVQKSLDPLLRKMYLIVY